MKAVCGGKFYCMICLEVRIDGVGRFIYSLFQMGWWRFGKVRVIIHIHFQGFLEVVDDGCVLIFFFSKSCICSIMTSDSRGPYRGFLQ